MMKTMLLKRLEIAGFKSFARKAELSFDAPIVSIVGPNGSGKSNVAESFRFVLGEQSIKSMRGKRGEDLIFNGTPQLGRLNRASVKLVFDNSTRFLPIEFDEVSIERVVHRDSVNEYFLNGSSCRLRDVTELLANANIGASGHHIISQGEADRILSAPAPERKEMIEEALGLKAFQAKKDEALRKLERTAENVEKTQSLRREIAPHLKYLKQQVERAEKAKALREELKGTYQEYLMREDAYVRAEAQRLVELERAPRQELETSATELAAARAQIESVSTHSDIMDEISKHETVLRTIREARSKAERELGEAMGEARSIARIAEEEKRRMEAEDSRVVPLREVRTLVQRLSSESGAASAFDTLKSIVDGVLESLHALVTRYEGDTAPQVGRDYTAEITELVSRQEAIKASIAHHDEQEVAARAALDDVRRQLDEAKEGTRDAERRVLTIVARRNELEGVLASIRRERERLSMEETELKRELTEAAVLVGRDVVSFYGEPPTEVFESEERAVQIERRRVVERAKIRLESMGVSGAEDAIREFNEVSERDAFLAREIMDLESSAAELRTIVADLEERISVKFAEGLAAINSEFSRLFAIMFGGGSAGLTLVRERRRKRRSEGDLEEEGSETEDANDGIEGVEISVDLPRKRVRSLAMLSGGERALASIALLFAMSQVNPPPFVILDETDAALDEANSRRYGDMIESLAGRSQLILITHNRETMSRAGAIFGVTMSGDGASRLLSIRFEDALKVAK
jgi:chromosome segregation protein